MFTTTLKTLRARVARIADILRAVHVPHRAVYASFAMLSLAGCMGLDKTLYGAVAACGYALLAWR